MTISRCLESTMEGLRLYLEPQKGILEKRACGVRDVQG